MGKFVNLNNSSMVNGLSFEEKKQVDSYITSIAKFKPLTREEEITLASQIQKGNKVAEEKFIKHNLLLALACAKHYQHLGLPLGDLIQFANIGLIEAVRKYTKYEEFRFSSFAVNYIRRAILAAVEENGSCIKTTHDVTKMNIKIRRVIDKYVMEHGYEPTKQEIAEILGVDFFDVKDAMSASVDVCSFDTPVGSDDGCTIGDFVQGYFEADANIATEDTNLEVQMILKVLNDKERTIVKMYYGIGYDYTYTFQMMADIVGLTETRCGQIFNLALKKMREYKK